jgi:hypothetical protein
MQSLDTSHPSPVTGVTPTVAFALTRLTTE